MSLRIDIENRGNIITFPFQKNTNGSREWPINLELEKNGEIYYAPLFTNVQDTTDIGKITPVKKPTIGFEFPEDSRYCKKITGDYPLLYLSEEVPKRNRNSKTYNSSESFSFILNNEFRINILSGAGASSNPGQKEEWNIYSNYETVGWYYGSPVKNWVTHRDKVKDYIAPSKGQDGQTIKGRITLDFLRFNETLRYDFVLPGGEGGIPFHSSDHTPRPGKDGKCFFFSAKETCLVTLDIEIVNSIKYTASLTKINENNVAMKAKDFEAPYIRDSYSRVAAYVSTEECNDFRKYTVADYER